VSGPDAEVAERVDLAIPQTEFTEFYYEIAPQIDRHNRQRQDDLEIERKLETKDWWKRVGLSIFGMCVVDACNVYNACAEDGCDPDPDTFYSMLAHEMIMNTYDERSSRSAAAGSVAAPPNAGVGKERKKKEFLILLGPSCERCELRVCTYDRK
jgi:hypothetical protein